MSVLENKVAIVTGGGRGIGKGIATALLKAGASVVITARSADQLAESQKELSAFGKVLAVQGDGANEANVIRTVETTIKEFGKIDMLINNAHASKPGISLIDTTQADFDLSFGSGFYSTFYYMKHCFPYLKESKGTVINFGSGAAIIGQEGQTSYAAAKEAIRGLSRVAVNEWGPFGINVNIILPFAETPSMLKWKADMPEAYASSMAKVPMRELAKSEENIGGLCVFLGTPAAKTLTGQTFGVDGGASMRP